MGGENSAFSFQADAAWGSSPRGRGKPRSDLTRYHGPRLIPAWAGKTGAGGGNFYQHEAHPRVGGENLTLSVESSRRLGSSPRGRGKPAHMAKESFGLTAHPRVGGENFGEHIREQIILGSSPRGRGKQGMGPVANQAVGLIPAWAGKTSA